MQIDYTFSDGSASATGSVTVDIVASNDAPTAIDDAFSATEAQIAGATSATPLLLGNLITGGTPDSDLEGNTLAVQSVSLGSVVVTDSDTNLTVEPVVTEGLGAGEVAQFRIRIDNAPPTLADQDAHLEIDSDGDVRIWSDTGEDPFRGLGAGESATISFDYVLSDGQGGTDTASATVTVNGVNDAPVLDAGDTPVLAAVNEDAGAPSGAVGTLISSLVDLPGGGGFDNVSDPDGDPVAGIALTGTAGSGTWWYSTDGGTNWSLVGAVSNTSGRLLAADANTRLYFEPNANFNGTVTNAITFRAWDGSTGSNGTGGVNTSTNGGATAFSTATDTANITVTAVNDVPTATITAASYSATEQTALTLANTGISIGSANDPADGNAGSMTVTLSVGEGTLTVAAGNSGVTGITGSGTSSVTFTGTVTQINNLLGGVNQGGAEGTIAYTATSNNPSASTILTLLVNDNGNTGTGGALRPATPRRSTSPR